MRPSARKSARSAWAAATGSWVTMTIVCPRSATERARKASTSAELRESRFPVGSSAKMMSGLLTRARAQATRCCCPPDNWDGLWARRSARPTAVITWSNQSRSGLRPAMAIGSSMFSRAVSVGTRLKAWKMKPMRSLRRAVSLASRSVLMVVSPMRTSPLVGLSSPATQCMSVDFPEPEGPMTAVNRPPLKSTST